MSINIERRINEHKIELEKNKHYNPHLQNAYNKYGSFYYEVLEETTEWMNEKEIMWINKLDTTLKGEGYNLTIGGEGFRDGEENFMYGKSKKELFGEDGWAEQNRKRSDTMKRRLANGGHKHLAKYCGSWNKDIKSSTGTHPWKRSDITKQMLVDMRNYGFIVREIKELLGIGHATFYAYWKKEELNV